MASAVGDGAISPWEAVLLGVVQGITEWLPISSDGHLVLAQNLLGIEEPVPFDALLHVATLLAVLVVFRRDVAAMARAVFTRDAWTDRAHPRNADARLALAVVVGTIPIVIAGFLLRDAVEESYGSLRIAAFGFLANAAILASTAFARPRLGVMPPGPWRALAIGVAQVFALLPGLSRSGSTMAAGMHAGLARPDAARVSFLLAIPALAGAGVLQSPRLPGLVELGWLPVALGFATAFLVGYAAIRGLLSFVRRHSFLPFAGYCAAVGLAILLALR